VNVRRREASTKPCSRTRRRTYWRRASSVTNTITSSRFIAGRIQEHGAGMNSENAGSGCNRMRGG
jgi:hypothetical protein